MVSLRKFKTLVTKVEVIVYSYMDDMDQLNAQITGTLNKPLAGILILHFI